MRLTPEPIPDRDDELTNPPRIIQTNEYLHEKSVSDSPYHLIGYLLNEPYSATYINERGIEIPGKGTIEIVAMQDLHGTWIASDSEERIGGVRVTISDDERKECSESVVQLTNESEIERLFTDLTQAMRDGGYVLAHHARRLAA